jgi:Delta3-Delta2-enoyl-CoA isomerase
MIDLCLQDDVYVLRMHHDENRFNRTSVAALNAALDTVEHSTIPTALVTVGEGKFFSNGLDLQWMSGLTAAESKAHVQRVHELLVRVLTLPVITVAALNGHAFAAGGMIALAHDFRVMRTDRGFFCLPEVDIKIPFTQTMQALIIARLSKQTAHEACVTGKRYGGELALTRGIVDEIAAEANVLPRAVALAKTFVGKDRATLAAIKRNAYSQVSAALELDRVALL